MRGRAATRVPRAAIARHRQVNRAYRTPRNRRTRKAGGRRVSARHASYDSLTRFRRFHRVHLEELRRLRAELGRSNEEQQPGRATGTGGAALVTRQEMQEALAALNLSNTIAQLQARVAYLEGFYYPSPPAPPHVIVSL